MCSIDYHICECGAEYKCYQNDAECMVFNGYPEICGACESIIQELHEEETWRERQAKWEDEEFERLYGPR